MANIEEISETFRTLTKQAFDCLAKDTDAYGDLRHRWEDDWVPNVLYAQQETNATPASAGHAIFFAAYCVEAALRQFEELVR